LWESSPRSPQPLPWELPTPPREFPPPFTADVNANAITEKLPASPPTATKGIAKATAGMAVASASVSAADDTADATAGIVPAYAAVSATAFVAKATAGLFPAFRSLRRPCDDNLYNIESPRLVQREHCDWQRLLEWHCRWLWVQ